MPDFAAEIMRSHSEYSAVDIANIGTPLTGQPPSQPPPSIPVPPTSSMVQGIQKCIGDYDKLPLGWREAPFMGKCGFKIQHKHFYSADTPCYPIQDISCLGPMQKKAWANICATEFPCRPPKAPLPQLLSHPTPHDSYWDLIVATINEHLAYIVGVSVVSCVTAGYAISRIISPGERSKDDKRDFPT